MVVRGGMCGVIYVFNFKKALWLQIKATIKVFFKKEFCLGNE